jgi:hypothetical protein
MFEMVENGQRALNGLMRFAPFHVHDETNAAGVVFRACVIEACFRPTLMGKGGALDRHLRDTCSDNPLGRG